MTATPIPRTLTLTHYGEMDVSRLDEMPPGRQPIETRVVSDERLAEVVDALGRHLAAGKQAYWVCPLVEESEAATSPPPRSARGCCGCASATRSALVHGRMKGPEKDAVMDAFQRGADRGAGRDDGDRGRRRRAQRDADDRRACRPLRPRPAPPAARAGSGAATQHSICLLLRGNALSETARARLTLMRETNDGFRIAEEDLRLRGAGEMLGTRQSGEAQFRLASPEQIAGAGPDRDRRRPPAGRPRRRAGRRAGQAARVLLYLMERDAAVGLLRGG